MHIETALEGCPLVAILRGLPAADAAAVGQALVTAGVRALVVPLTHGEALDGIAALVGHLGERALVGACEVTAMADLRALVDRRARLVMTPHVDPALLSRARALDLETIAGCLTPSEAILALQAGAQALAWSPAHQSTPPALAALCGILPPDVLVLPTGRVTPEQMGHWWAAGARGFGLGGTLYAPGRTPAAIERRARACVRAIRGDTGAR